MLLFPTTLLPGCAGIPSMISYSAAFCHWAVARVEAATSDVRAQVRLLAGTLISTGGVWVDERSDDTAPAELKLCRGDDCDGLSISARALLRSVAKHSPSAVGRLLRRSDILLVAGTANLAHSHAGGEAAAHMWVGVFPRENGACVINCECTALRGDEKHFRMTAYLWSCSSCWVVVGADNKIGAPASGAPPTIRELPASSKLRSILSRAYYHIVSEAYADRVYHLR